MQLQNHKGKPSKTLELDKSKILELTSDNTCVVVLTKNVEDYESKKHKSIRVIHSENDINDMNEFLTVISDIEEGNHLIIIDGFSDYFNNPTLSQKDRGGIIKGIDKVSHIKGVQLCIYNQEELAS